MKDATCLVCCIAQFGIVYVSKDRLNTLAINKMSTFRSLLFTKMHLLNVVFTAFNDNTINKFYLNTAQDLSTTNLLKYCVYSYLFVLIVVNYISFVHSLFNYSSSFWEVFFSIFSRGNSVKKYFELLF